MAAIPIDLFEMQVLIEASWYDGTILRHSIMQRAINQFYHQLNEEERARTYEFFLRTQGDNAKNNIQKMFLARYNPANQYAVETNFENNPQTVTAFLFNGKYHTFETVHIAPQYIVKATPIKP